MTTSPPAPSAAPERASRSASSSASRSSSRSEIVAVCRAIVQPASVMPRVGGPKLYRCDGRPRGGNSPSPHPPQEGAPQMSEVLDRIRNGVDSGQMYGTLDAIKDDPSLGIFQFRARNHWIDGAHNRSTIQGFYGAGHEDRSRAQAFTADAGEPAVLLGF